MGTLHLVATPIGNLEDVTLRALRVLREVEQVFAEDTRRTGILLKHHGISQRPRSLYAHNEAGRISEALEILDAGADIALVSDAARRCSVILEKDCSPRHSSKGITSRSSRAHLRW